MSGKFASGGQNAGAHEKRVIKALSYYDILENEDNELLFTITRSEGGPDAPDNPKLYYDGGDHAIFVKNSTAAVLCDFIHPGVRGSLSRCKEVLFAELEDGGIKREYMAPVVHCESIKSVADELMLMIEMKGGEDNGW
jgi:hypothetical protein